MKSRYQTISPNGEYRNLTIENFPKVISFLNSQFIEIPKSDPSLEGMIRDAVTNFWNKPNQIIEIENDLWNILKEEYFQNFPKNHALHTIFHIPIHFRKEGWRIYLKEKIKLEEIKKEEKATVSDYINIAQSLNSVNNI